MARSFLDKEYNLKLKQFQSIPTVKETNLFQTMLSYNRLGQGKVRTPVSFRLHYPWESYSSVSSRPVGFKCSINLSCVPEVAPTFTPLATPSHAPAIKYFKGQRARELRVTEGLAGHQHTPGTSDTGSIFYSFSLSVPPLFCELSRESPVSYSDACQKQVGSWAKPTLLQHLDAGLSLDLFLTFLLLSLLCFTIPLLSFSVSVSISSQLSPILINLRMILIIKTI